MNPKMFIQPAIRISVIAAVIIGILILFGVRWWVALLSVLGIIAVIALLAVWVIKRQRRQFTERLKAFNIDPESGRINPADLRRMYNSGGQAQALKEMSMFNPNARQAQMKAMQEMQAQQRKGKGKGKGGFR